MKEFLAVISLVISTVFGDAPPYPPNGWTPSGPSFELPNPTSQRPNVYISPVDPRNRFPSDVTPDFSVQGLPVSEQVPHFQVTPISGQQYVGPAVEADIARLNEQNRRAQIEKQESQLRNIERQRQIFTSIPQKTASNTPQATRKFVGASTKPIETTTASVKNVSPINTASLNLGEVNSNVKQNRVEISKQNIQEYPPELFLNPLSQIRFASTPNGEQFGQLIFQENVPEVSQRQPVFGLDGPVHLKALQSVLEQQKNQKHNQQLVKEYIVPPQNPGFVLASMPQGQQHLLPPQQYQLQPVLLQPNTQISFEQMTEEDLRPKEAINKEVGNYKDEDINQQNYQPFLHQQFQYVGQLQPQQLQYPVPQPRLDQTQLDQTQLYSQPQSYQPQEVELHPQISFKQSYQPQEIGQLTYQSQDVNFQPQTYQTSGIQFKEQQNNQYQSRVQNENQQQPQVQANPQQARNQPDPLNPQINIYQNIPRYFGNIPQATHGVLQSDLNADQEENRIEKQENNEDNNSEQSSLPMQPAFGERTSPRVYSAYGVPFSVSNEQPTISDNRSDQDDKQTEQTTSTEEAPSIAEATAVARGSRRRNSKFRSRPVFVVDRSGYLMLQGSSQQQTKEVDVQI